MHKDYGRAELTFCQVLSAYPDHSTTLQSAVYLAPLPITSQKGATCFPSVKYIDGL